MTKAQASLADLSDPVLVAALFALDPHGFGGVRLRGGPGPERDVWLELLEELLPKSAPLRKCPASVSDDALLGSMDLVATLQTGQPRSQPGLLTQADDGVILFAMAERLPAACAARVAACLDQGLVFLARDGVQNHAPARFGVVLLDEGQSSEELPPAAVLDRCAFAFSASAITLGETESAPFDHDAIQQARRRFAARPALSDALIEALCQAAEAFGVTSLRPALFAVRTTSALAALDGRSAPVLEDAALAARLTLAPFAKTLPAPEEPREQPPPTDGPDREDQTPDLKDREPKDQTQVQWDEPPVEILVAAIKAALPAELLATLAQVGETRGLASPGPGGGGGARQASRRRGRPLGVRASKLRPGDRLSIIDTLRAAAPWQPLRRRLEPERQGLLVRPSDFRIRHFKLEQGAVAILVVDASGSSAFQRLAEAKGAAELLLAQAYRTRAHVALIVFRKTDARLALPPTRSLSRARKLLADMAGGGGTPLAAGLDAGLALALQERARGRTPRLLIFTDGRPNIARDGEPGRPAAEMDALAAATAIRKAGVSSVYIDTSARPSPDADRFARAMAGAFAALPHGDATAMVRAAERQSAG